MAKRNPRKPSAKTGHHGVPSNGWADPEVRIEVLGLTSIERVNAFTRQLHGGEVELAICEMMTQAIQRARAARSNDPVAFDVYVYMGLHGCATFFCDASTPEDFVKAIARDPVWRGIKPIRMLKDPSLLDGVAEHMGNGIGLVAYCFGYFTKKVATSERTILDSIASEPEARDKAAQFIASLKKSRPHWTDRE